MQAVPHGERGSLWEEAKGQKGPRARDQRPEVVKSHDLGFVLRRAWPKGKGMASQCGMVIRRVFAFGPCTALSCLLELVAVTP